MGYGYHIEDLYQNCCLKETDYLSQARIPILNATYRCKPFIFKTFTI